MPNTKPSPLASPHPTTAPPPATTESSWWVGDEASFAAALPDAQGRMRRELPIPAVQDYLDMVLKSEEAALRFSAHGGDDDA